MTGLLARVTALRVPKAGNTKEQCEDACALHGNYVAVSDGASATFESRLWARLLADSFVRHPPLDLRNRTLVVDWADATSKDWTAAIPWDSLTLYEGPAASMGSAATLLGVRFDETTPGRGRIWTCLAIGDSCLFQVRAGSLVIKFPVERSADFGLHPALVSTDRTITEQYLDQFVVRTGIWGDGDEFFLLTDAIAAWFLREAEAGGRPWEFLAGLDQDSLAEFVEDRRSHLLMRNDDVTVVHLRIGAPQAGPPAPDAKAGAGTGGRGSGQHATRPQSGWEARSEQARRHPPVKEALPGRGRPGQHRPDQSRPEQSRPDQSRPDQSRRSQPKRGQPRPDQPQQDQPQQHRPQRDPDRRRNPGQPRPDRRRRHSAAPDFRRRWRGVAALLIVCIAALTGAVFWLTSASAPAPRPPRGTTAEHDARRVVAALVGFQAGQQSHYLARLDRLCTVPLARSVPALLNLGSPSSAADDSAGRLVALSAASSTRTTAVLYAVVRQTITVAATGTASADTLLIRLVMARRGRRWLASGITFTGTSDGLLPPAPRSQKKHGRHA